MSLWLRIKIRLESWYWCIYWFWHDDPEDEFEVLDERAADRQKETKA